MFTDLLHRVYRHYEALHQAIPPDPDTGLGGKLLYAGGLTNADLLYASNIAGVASIAASADPATQRQAIRESTIDFLVTSLEEALRILKNEIRKRQTVSVGVSMDPAQLTAQILDRGVLPDLLFACPPDAERTLLLQGALKIVNPGQTNPVRDRQFITWYADRDFNRILPQLDSLASQAIPEQDFVRQRWLRLAPRYVGRAAQRLHGIPMTDEEFAKFQTLSKDLQLLTESGLLTIKAVSMKITGPNSIPANF
jgi:hypothetical protein